MYNISLFWRGCLMVPFILGVVITGYPAAFIVTHGFDPSGWPRVLDGPGIWFESLGLGNFGMLFKLYGEMAWRECKAFAGGGFLEGSILVSGVVCAIVVVMLGGGKINRRSSSTIYGSTDWATKSDLGRLNKGLEIGFDPMTKRRVRIQVEGNLLTIAPPRTGKTDGFVIPNLAFPEKNAWCGPAVVIDPKGDAYKAVKRRREALGRTVRCLDPLGLVGGQDRWNPLVRINPANVLYMQSVARALLPNTAASDNSAYFTNNAVDLIVGAMIAAIKNGRADPVGAAFFLDHQSDLRKALENREDAASRAALLVLNIEGATGDSIRSTAGQATKWLLDTQMQSVVMDHTFEMTDLLNGDVDLFIVLPADDRKEILAPYARWLLSDLFAAVRLRPPEERILVLIDEANVLGNFKAILDGAGELPGYGISLWTIWQNRSQIVTTYGENGANTLLATAQMINLFNLSRALPDEIEHWSRAIGSFTGFGETTSSDDNSNKKSKSSTLEAQRIVPATDLPQLLSSRQVVFLNQLGHTTNPLNLGRTRAHLDQRFKGIMDPTPPVGQIR